MIRFSFNEQLKTDLVCTTVLWRFVRLHDFVGAHVRAGQMLSAGKYRPAAFFTGMKSQPHGTVNYS